MANLTRTNLTRANLASADLTEANLTGVDLRDTIIDSHTKLDQKWRLVWEIVNQPTEKRNLSGGEPQWYYPYWSRSQ